MSFTVNECIYIRDSSKVIVELIPARVVWAEGGKIVVELEADRLREFEEEVLIFYTIDRTFVQQAAAKLAHRADNVEDAFEITIGRKPSDGEADQLEMLREEYGMTSVCVALLNSSEFVYQP